MSSVGKISVTILQARGDSNPESDNLIKKMGYRKPVNEAQMCDGHLPCDSLSLVVSPRILRPL